MDDNTSRMNELKVRCRHAESCIHKLLDETETLRQEVRFCKDVALRMRRLVREERFHSAVLSALKRSFSDTGGGIFFTSGVWPMAKRSFGVTVSELNEMDRPDSCSSDAWRKFTLEDEIPF